MRTFRLTSRTMPLSLVAVPVRAILLTACSSPSPAAPSVATFEVEGQEFKIELDTAELVQNAQDLLDDKEAPSIPVGNIVRNDPSINTPWSWHIDPASVEFADMTTEVCDGLPEHVEDGTLTSNIYCPWGAKIVSLAPLP